MTLTKIYELPPETAILMWQLRVWRPTIWRVWMWLNLLPSL